MKKSITLNLSMSEIIYDIQNKTYLTGRSVAGADNHSHVANMQANDDDENAAQILRSITMAAMILRNRLSEFLDAKDLMSTNESLSEKDDISLTLDMPSNFNPSVTKSLAEVAHEFIVASAVADWFAITAKGETTDYTQVAKNCLSVLEEAICKRSRPSRPSKD
ncbi:MAG: hypothetical protein J1F16_05755 [Muribaculaceae bacterium]|nr:hypothetical protein [Muribaculaceae bacterium]